MKNNFNKIYPVLFSIGFIFIACFISFYIACFFDKNMLIKLWAKYDTMKNLPFSLSSDDLYNLQNELMSYLRGKIPFLETKVTIDGVLTDFYSIRTKVHMGDVRVVIRNFAYITYFCIAICIFSLFKIRTMDKPFLLISKSYNKTIVAFAIILSIIIIFAIFNFDLFFTRFHEMLFTNDFWLLDPNEDYIICLLPEQIFMEIGIKIIVILIIILVLFHFLYRTLSKIQLSPEAR